MIARLPITDDRDVHLARVGQEMSHYLHDQRANGRRVNAEDLWDELDQKNREAQQKAYEFACENKLISPFKDEGRIPGLYEFNAIAQKLNAKYSLDVLFTPNQVRELRSNLNVLRGLYFARVQSPILKSEKESLKELYDALVTVLQLTDRSVEQVGLMHDRFDLVFEHIVNFMPSTQLLGNGEPSLNMIRNLRTPLEELRQSVEIVRENYDAIKFNSGNKKLKEYREFLSLMSHVAIEHDIPTTAHKHRSSGKYTGVLFDLVSEFEEFLPNDMRAKSPSTTLERIKTYRKEQKRAEKNTSPKK